MMQTLENKSPDAVAKDNGCGDDLRADRHPPAIEASKLTVYRGGRRILARLDWQLHPGQLCCLMGANGAGKTTLLRCLAGSLRPADGEVRWFGKGTVRRPAAHRLLGVVSHECFVYSELSTAENLLFAARMYGVRSPQHRVEELLSLGQLTRCRHRRAGQLSRGTLQRLAIVRSLVHDPPILLMDEPFTGLDADSREWLEQLLLELRSRQRAICITSHDSRQSRRLADVVQVLQAGHLRPLPDDVKPARTDHHPLRRSA